MTDQEAVHSRAKLLPYLGKRVQCTATLQRYGDYYDPAFRRDVPTANMVQIEVESAVIVDHCWVRFATPLVRAGAEPGDTVQFTAIVYKFRGRHPDNPTQAVTRYALERPADIRVDPLDG